MELTREEAIRNFREHWGSLAITGTDDKKEYLKRNGFPEIQDSCFLCEFTKRTCSKCPVEWPNMKTISLACVSSIYGEWGRAAAPEERSRLAALIRDLPIKEYEKPAPKFAVGDKVVPVSKSVGASFEIWTRYRKRDYVTVQQLPPNKFGDCYVCNSDFFLESDLIPYVEEVKPEPVKEFKVGDRVVPHAIHWPNWTWEKYEKCIAVLPKFLRENGYLFVCGKNKDGEYLLSDIPEDKGSDRFSANELTLYVEPEVKPDPVKEEPKPAFKVGDRVRVKSPCSYHVGEMAVISEIVEHLYGVEFINKPLDNASPKWNRLHPDKIGCGFYTREEYLELAPINQAPENKTLTESKTFIIKGNKTTCIIEIDGRRFKGVAKCGPKDKWDEKTGRGWAELRAQRKLLDACEKELRGN